MDLKKLCENVKTSNTYEQIEISDSVNECCTQLSKIDTNGLGIWFGICVDIIINGNVYGYFITTPNIDNFISPTQFNHKTYGNDYEFNTYNDRECVYEYDFITKDTNIDEFVYELKPYSELITDLFEIQNCKIDMGTIYLNVDSGIYCDIPNNNQS